MLAHADRCRAEIERIEGAEERTEELERELAGALRARTDLAARLTEPRSARKRAQAEAAARAARLDDLAGRRDQVWQEVEDRITTTRPDEYDRAVALLADLYALAEREGEQLAFDRPRAHLGPQPESLAGAKLWVLPNPSGLNANHQLPDLARLFRALRKAAKLGRRGAC